LVLVAQVKHLLVLETTALILLFLALRLFQH
jgi:hypothetical protein